MTNKHDTTALIRAAAAANLPPARSFLRRSTLSGVRLVSLSFIECEHQATAEKPRVPAATSRLSAGVGRREEQAMQGDLVSEFEKRLIHDVLDARPILLEVIGDNAALRAYWQELMARYRAQLIATVERGAAVRVVRPVPGTPATARAPARLTPKPGPSLRKEPLRTDDVGQQHNQLKLRTAGPLSNPDAAA